MSNILDSIDKSILIALQKDGRLANAVLAKQNNLAPSSMLSRVRRLESKGIIKSYRAVLDPKQLGYHIQAIIMITLDQHQVGSIDAFEDHIRKINEVKEGYHITGRYDYMLIAVLRDIDHLNEMIKQHLTKIPGLMRQETFLIFSSLKQDEGYSLEYVDDKK